VSCSGARPPPLALGAALGTTAAVWSAQRRLAASKAAAAACDSVHPVTGAAPGPFPVGVTTVQLDDHSRKDPDGGPRSLQTEIWYPAADEAREVPSNKYSEFLGRGASPEFIARAEDSDAIGGYRAGLTIEELDRTWQNLGKRDVRVREPVPGERWPVVIFSHGSGAFRASYVYFTEFLASHGFVVVACDHAGSSRYTILNGTVVKGGGARGEASQTDRPLDVLFLLDAVQRMAMGGDSRFAGRVDASCCAVTGMSFGGWTAARVLDMKDDRVKAAVLHCPSLARGELTRVVDRPVMVMLGTEDTVIGAEGNSLCRDYFRRARGPRFLVEVRKGGHVTFTSCEQYNAAYGSGIGPSRSLTEPGATYEPLSPGAAHAIVNSYTLAFLDVHVRGRHDRQAFLESNHFEEDIDYHAS